MRENGEMMPAKIAIIGMGHVGTSMHGLLHDRTEIITYDSAEDAHYPAREIATCDAAIVCVGTPMNDDGTCDTSHVREAVSELPVATVMLKSTVPPGTTDLLASATGKQICFSPEYVGESDYRDQFWPGGPSEVPFMILGGELSVRRQFIDMFQPVLGPAKVYFQCTAREAEIIKYMENAYLATKVCFVNEFRRVCGAFGADWHTVREGWLLDPRVEPDHSAAFAASPGFGGRCLPKDLSAIVRATAAAGYSPSLLMEVLSSNERFCGEAGRTGAPATNGQASPADGLPTHAGPAVI
jgi:UDPglucose 6-dehydrogenase